MSGFPRAGWNNLLDTSPLLVPGLRASATAVEPAATANRANNTAGAGLTGVGPLVWNGATFLRLSSANSRGDDDGGDYQPTVAPYAFNGATMDRWRNNEHRVLLAQGVRNVSTPSPIQTNFNCRGAVFLLALGAAPGVTTVQLQVRWWVLGFGAAFNVAVCPVRVAAGNDILVVYPGAATVYAGGSAVTVQSILPRQFDVNVLHSGAGDFDYAVECSLIQ